MKPSACVALPLLLGCCELARAGDDGPLLEFELTTDLQSEWGVLSERRDDERGETYAEIEGEFELRLAPSLTVEGTLLGEPVEDPASGRNAWLDDEGAFVEELLLKYERGPLEVVAGKFSPDYRNSREQERGIWTEDFSTEYEIVEKLGVGASWSLRSRVLGRHSASLNVFANDDSVLAESIGNARDERCRGDRDWSSSAFLFEGQRRTGAITPYYQLGYRHIDGCAQGDDDEAGWLWRLGAIAELPATGRTESDLLFEAGFVEDFEGKGQDRWYWSFSSVTRIDRIWTLNVGATLRQIAYAGRSDALDHLAQITLGFRPRKGVRIEGGWLNFEEAGLRSNALGLLLRYRVRF